MSDDLFDYLPSKKESISIDEFKKYISPFVKKGWIAMSENFYKAPNSWRWFETKPSISESMRIWRGDCDSYDLNMFNISPVEDWKKSLFEVKK